MAEPAQRQRLPRDPAWVRATPSGTVQYRPPHYPRPTQRELAFPAPPIRRHRAHRGRSIHILAYPPGWIPNDLTESEISRKARKEQRKQDGQRNTNSKKSKANKNKQKKAAKQEAQSPAVTSTRETSFTKVALDKLLSPFTSKPQAATSSTTPASQPSSRRPSTAGSILSRLPICRPEDPNFLNRFPIRRPEDPNFLHFDMAAHMRPSHAQAPYGGPVPRNSMSSVKSAKNAVSSFVSEVPKPVAAGSGVSCSILLAEPDVFLTGFEHDGHRPEGQTGTALLRGRLQLNVTKNVKIKGVSLKLLGKARTEWPEGIPPLKVDMFEEESLRTQVLTFFNAMNDGWETDYGNSCTYRMKNASNNSSTTNLASTRRNSLAPSASNLSSVTGRNSMSSRETKRLSLQANQSRSFGKGEATHVNSVQAKGYRVFYPGTYEYNFELPIDHHQLETTKLQYGSVKWELHAQVERAGAFKPNLHGMKEVPIVRVPDQLSLETTEPISISRQWEDQLHYDIIISGKSFPIGSKIPIAFKLTPLAKVQVHKLKVFCTESIEYWTNDRRVTRKDPGRKILLLEKVAGKKLDPQYAQSEVNVLSGGELSPRERHEAREAAALRRTLEASRHNAMPQPLPEASDNLLGDLDLGLESYWGSTEIEMNVQLPTCEQMAKSKEFRLNPDCSWKNVNVYHWIKIVMRISRIDPEDPTGTRRRHFEISIDSPFTVLNCRATQQNTALPSYSGLNADGQSRQSACGCPDAPVVAGPVDPSPSSSTGTLPTVEGNPNPSVQDILPAPPQPAHLTDSNPASTHPATTFAASNAAETGASGRVSPPTSQNQSIDALHARPIHLLRVPSYNPPAFDAEEPPPIDSSEPNEVAQTPPPHYDVIVGTPSVDGLADYFSRLSEYNFDPPDDDSDSADEGPASIMERGGRVNVAHPRTPGGRRAPSRSMELARPAVNLRSDALPGNRGEASGATNNGA